ncbi:MAG: hypothetical protein GY856_26480, partial [bacterium]|nr:hypothetical protein [bacterium]
RRALPAPEDGRRDLGAYVAPRHKTERVLAAIWQQLLGLEEIGVHDNFFDAGGHSLLMVRLRDRVHERLGCELSLVDLFEYPTIRTLGRHLDRKDGSDSAASPVAELPRPVGRRLTAVKQQQQVRRRHREADRGTPAPES